MITKANKTQEQIEEQNEAFMHEVIESNKMRDEGV